MWLIYSVSAEIVPLVPSVLVIDRPIANLPDNGIRKFDWFANDLL